MNTTKITAHIFILLATTLIAGSFIATKKLAGVIDPFSLILLRFLAAVVLLSPFILLNPKHRKNIKKTMPRAMAISLFYAGYFLLMLVSLETTTALNTGALYTLVPLITAILCIFIFKEKVTFVQAIVYIIGIVGTCGVVFNADFKLFLSFTLNSGDYVFLVAIFFMAFYSISMKLLYKDDNPILLVFCTLLGGAIWMAMVIIATNTPLNWEMVTGELFWYMAYLVVGTTLITLYLNQKAVLVLGPKSIMSYIYINPAIVALFAYFLDGEKISLEVFIAILVSAAATLILQISLNKRDA